jgi:glycosyltransferase involved in cell wall biosynthesis
VLEVKFTRSVFGRSQIGMSSLASARTLYLCYFGLREPLVQTQVLPYLRQLATVGVEVHLLTFEPEMSRRWSAEQRAAMRAQLQAAGIRWHARAYHKRPSAPATLYDIMMGAWTVIRLVRRYQIDVLHARAHIAMAMALLARRATNCRLVFDIRGLVADEYVDAGIWRENSPPFKAVKWVERRGIARADQLVVLTKRMRDWLVAHGLADAAKIEVIPCCFEFTPVQSNSTAQMAQARFEIVYAGSVTGLYMLEEMGRFFLALQAQQPDAFLRILTVSDAQAAAAILRRVGLKDADFRIGAVSPAEVQTHLRRARLGLSFRKPTFAQIAASPTKIPEYLAAGLPVVCNAGVGDMDELLASAHVGVLVRTFDAESYKAAAAAALALAAAADIRERCLCVAREHFDLISVGARGYRNVYQRLGHKLNT